MNHFMLPNRAGEEFGAKFGNVAVPQLISRMCELGCRACDLQAKVFGGACILQGFQQGSSELGQKNVDLARALLQAERIPIAGEDVGGPRGRKLIFSTDSGEALVKRL